MNEELKPCPFCGGEAEFDHASNIAIVRCKECGCCSRIGYLRRSYEWAKEKAKEKWNRRAELPCGYISKLPGVKLFATPLDPKAIQQQLQDMNKAYLTGMQQGKVAADVGFPEIICLCGSTRFYEAFQKANYELTMQGKIVLTVGFYPHSAEQAHGQNIGCTAEQKAALDELHKRKIDLADKVFVLNVGGYIGESTRSEIEYAKAYGKLVEYLEPKEAWHVS